MTQVWSSIDLGSRNVKNLKRLTKQEADCERDSCRNKDVGMIFLYLE